MFNTHVVGTCKFSERSDCRTVGTTQGAARGNQWPEGIVSRILQDILTAQSVEVIQVMLVKILSPSRM